MTIHSCVPQKYSRVFVVGGMWTNPYLWHLDQNLEPGNVPQNSHDTVWRSSPGFASRDGKHNEGGHRLGSLAVYLSPKEAFPRSE
jgi:hypothetical protein